MFDLIGENNHLLDLIVGGKQNKYLHYISQKTLTWYCSMTLLSIESLAPHCEVSEEVQESHQLQRQDEKEQEREER